MGKKAFPVIPILSLLMIGIAALPALGANITIEGSPTFWDHLLIFLTNDIVRTILLIIGIAGVVIEIATVGSFGVFGVLGIIGFALYFMGNIWLGSFGTAALVFLIVGLILLIVEIFAIPGFGVAGAAGILAILASLVLASPNPATAICSVLIALVAAIGIIWFTLKNKKTRRAWKKLVLFERTANEEGYIAPDPKLSQYQGKRGTALTILRPAGTALIDGDRLDVVTSGEFVEEGKEIEVVYIEGLRVVVREVLTR